MSAKYKGIYMMTVAKRAASVEETFVLQNLQHLANTDVYFNMLWTQARSESPPFHEGTQNITNHNLTFERIVVNYKSWLQQAGVTLDRRRWDSYFFHNDVPDPTDQRWRRYLLVYFDVNNTDANSTWIKEHASFVFDYTLAVRNNDKSRGERLLGSAVQCAACKKIVDPAHRATFKNDGYLTCPYCDQWWTQSTKAIKDTEMQSRPEQGSKSRLEKKWWQFWKENPG